MKTFVSTGVVLFLVCVLGISGALAQATPTTGDFVVSETLSDARYESRMAMDASGAFVAVWYEYIPTHYGYLVGARLFDANGDPVGDQFFANDIWVGDQDQPSVDMAPDGRFVIAWRGYDEAGVAGVFARIFDAQGAPLAPQFRVANLRANYPEVAVADDGSFVIAWRESTGEYAQRFSPTGAPLFAPVFVGVAGSYNYRSVAVVPQGQFAVARRASDGPRVHIFDGQGNSTSGDILVSATTAARETWVVMNADGSARVVWDHRPVSPQHELKTVRLDANGVVIGAEATLWTQNGEYFYDANIAADGTGDFAFVWRPQQSGVYTVKVGRWDIDANQIEVFDANESSNYPWIGWPDLGISENTLAVVWNSDGSYGDGDIFGRHFVLHPEIKHDGIDQDGNGYDLTIEVTQAAYDAAQDALDITAKSDLGSAAALTVTGFGAMTWESNKGQWVLAVNPAGGNPGEVEVCGVEGCFTAGVSTWHYEQHQFGFVDTLGNMLMPNEDVPMTGVQAGDILLMRLAFKDHGDASQGITFRLRTYTSQSDFEADVNYGYVEAPGAGTDWEYVDVCAAGEWCDDGSALTTAVTSDHAPEPGFAFEADPESFAWLPNGQNSGCENQFNIRYVGTQMQSLKWYFRYEVNGVTMPYSSMHYGGRKGSAVQTNP